jgi:hypothetical protein
MWQVGKSVWLARNQTHESIETTPLNSAVFPINSSKRREKKKKHRRFAPNKNGGASNLSSPKTWTKT